MEICTRAISFWTYQTAQEAKYQEMTRRAMEDKIHLYEKQQQRITREVSLEINALQKDLEQERRKTADLSDQLDEKARQLSKLQTLYERQKRRPLFTETPQHPLQQLHDNDSLLGGDGNPYRTFQNISGSALYTQAIYARLFAYDRPGNNLNHLQRSISHHGLPSDGGFAASVASAGGLGRNADMRSYSSGSINGRLGAMPLLSRGEHAVGRGHEQGHGQIQGQGQSYPLPVTTRGGTLLRDAFKGK
ncbi:hypothetical protein EDD21DRAFT_422370 [Dissophora ornata]|nr:hypothetical protein EDD21DRAFT_422370 [Dissophora ornata]